MYSASTSYINRQPWRPSGTMISPPCRTRSRSFHKGLTFFVLSILILLSGAVMTVSGFMGLADSGISFLGMLLMAISVLLFLAGLRQYLMIRKMKAREHTVEVTHSTVAAALVIEGDDNNRTLTVVMDTVNMDMASLGRRSTEGSLPPDYIEATTGSDLYSDSVCVVTDALDDPPPPYGPPTYEQATSLDHSFLTQVQCDVNFRHQSMPHLFYDRDTQFGLTNQQQGALTNQQEGAVTNQMTETESQAPAAYQDLPTVTI